MSAWLFEIGCEELPATVCTAVLRQLRDSADGDGLVHRLLVEHRLLPEPFAADQLRVLISPRRIAVLVSGLPDRQTARVQVYRGPRADVAFGPDGTPTKAGQGFARSRGLSPEDLGRETVDGTEFVCARVEAERRSAAEVLPGVCRALIAGIQVPRGMRWGARPAGQADFLRFSRPIRWLVCKLGAETISFPYYDLVCGDVSRGHRVLGTPVTVTAAEDYERALESQHVLVDHDRRREVIVAGLDARAREAGGVWFDPGDVLAEAVFLVEWPSVELGAFSSTRLRLPAQVLITAMQSHQRYFPVRDDGGGLLPSFLYVSNADPACASLIGRGNRRVLEGRLDDAAFAFDRDVAEGLRAMSGRLDAVVFHEKLGTLAQKSERLRGLVSWLAVCMPAEDELGTALEQAASLAKADLVSQVVIEFPSLQGVMGGLYAISGGLPPDIAAAIGEHYLPLSATAPVPATTVGALLAVADKVDNIVGAWVAGEKPSGSRDPYGLRRAAMGIVRIAVEYSLRFSLQGLVATARGAYETQGRSLADDGSEIVAFIRERLEVLMLDEGVPFDAVAAAVGSGADELPGLAARAHVCAARREEARFQDACVAYTRCASLASKAGEAGAGVSPALFKDDAEQVLFDACEAALRPIRESLQQLEIGRALESAAGLRPAVDRYFDAVLVMDADPVVRANRLAQLARISAALRSIADFSRMAV